MIIPYGHSGLRMTGPPWVTVVVIVLCVVALGVTQGPESEAEARSNRIFRDIVTTFTSVPGLEPEPAMAEMIFTRLDVDDNEREVFLEALADNAPAATEAERAAAQDEIDRLTDRFWDVYRSSPSYRWGLVPSAISVSDLVTYQFMHAGWGHLFSNLLILFLAAPYLEQRWGPAPFVGFYLTAGVVSALFWAFRYPDLDLPLVGASGAVAGLMGAFLICFGSSRIRFLYIGGTFEAPAWLMLPLWLVLEVISGRAMDVASPGVGGGVAHWAHVWGFIFGMAVAWGFAVTGLDRRLADRQRPPAVADRSPRPPQPRHAQARTGRAPSVSEPPPHPAASTADSAPGIEPDSHPMEAPAAETPDTGLPTDPGPTVELRPAERLKVVEGVPTSLDGPTLLFTVPEGRRRLELSRVEAIAVGAVTRPGGRPFVVVDLLLDPPWSGDGDLRVLRLLSSSFDPRAIAGGEHAMAAFSDMLDRLLSASAAVPLPDAEAFRSPGTTTYPSLVEYQSEVLGVI